ncbi:MAG: hypothetical protein M1814_001761 [Vezdaea aestivalis]|nr:MAG: hypothetical protein M1814_001761 [Vezdaea aestivalis]
MAKAEPLRDYYADLDLTPQADVDEIKKQYRKLALKYHPDRNRGHEEEASLKFQNIQAANEILTDPQERAKYDASRRRAAGLSANRTRPPPKSPYEQTPYYPKTDFPPPPRRSQPSSQPRPAFTTSASAFAGSSSGSKRYQQFAKNFTKPAGQDAPRQAPQAGYRTASPEPIFSTSPPKSRQTRTHAPPGPPPNLNRSQSSRVPRPNTFNPNTATADEPPAKTASAYYNISRGEKPTAPNVHSSSESSSETSPVPRGAPPPPPIPPRGQQRNGYSQHPGIFVPDAQRRTTSYSNVGGDRLDPRLDPFSESFARSASMNEGSGSKKGPGPSHLHTVETPGSERRRSASPPQSRYTTEYVNNSRQAGATFAGAPPRRTNSADDPATHSGRNASTKTARNRLGVPLEESDISEDDRHYSSGGRNEQMERMAEDELHRRSTKKKDGSQRFSKPKRLSEEYANRERSSPRMSTGDFPPPSARFDNMNLGGKSKSRENSGIGPGRSDPSSIQDPRAHPPESAQARFSTPNWANEMFNSDGAERRGSTSSDRRGRPARQETSSSKSPKTAAAAFAQTNGIPHGTGSPRESKFSEREWGPGFDNPDFIAPSSELRTSPVRGNSYQANSSANRSRVPKGRKTTKTPKKSGNTKAPNVVSVSDAEDDDLIYVGTQHRNGIGRSSGHSSGRDSNAMDIDSPPQTERSEAFDRRDSASRRVRMESFDRNRPEFRAQGSFQVNGSAASSVKRPVPPIPLAPSPPRDNSAYNMDSFANVEPLRRPNAGLHNMKDVNDAVPFESRASSHPPSFSDSDRSQLPSAPTAPRMGPTVDHWESYVVGMKSYMTQWDLFNRNMLSLYQKNQDTRYRLGTDWLGVLNESDKAGYFRYAKTVDNDMAWRSYWTNKCDEHQGALKEFGRVREQVRQAKEGSRTR